MEVVKGRMETGQRLTKVTKQLFYTLLRITGFFPFMESPTSNNFFLLLTGEKGILDYHSKA